MKPIFIASLTGVAVLAGGVLLASDVGDWMSRIDRSSPEVGDVSVVPAVMQLGENLETQNNASLQTVSLKVGNLWCASCPVIVRRALEQVEGVRKANVSFRSKTATVAFDPSRCDVAKLMAATGAIGFPSTLVQ